MAIKAVVHKKLQAPGSKSLEERGKFVTGQFLEDGRTRIPWSLLKKRCTMIGRTENSIGMSELIQIRTISSLGSL